MECEKLGVCGFIDKNVCCMECEKRAKCADCCTDTVCEHYHHETGLVAFKSGAVAVIKAVSDIEQAKKALDEKSKAMREQLQLAMEKYGVTKFENELIRVNYIASTTRKALDTARIKKELPVIAEKYTKISNVKASVKIEVK